MVYLTYGLEVRGHKGQGQTSRGSRSKVWVVGQRSRSPCKKHVLHTCWIEVGDENKHKYQGHVGQGQRSNKDPRERQVGSQQCQVATFLAEFFSWSLVSLVNLAILGVYWSWPKFSIFNQWKVLESAGWWKWKGTSLVSFKLMVFLN